MSETINAKKVPNNTINYIVFGREKDLELTATGKTQPAVHNIPGIPMEITVEPHTFEIAPNGEIIRKGKNGEKLRGQVRNKKVIETIQGISEER